MSWKKVKLGDLCRIEKGITGIQKAIPGPFPLVVTSKNRKTHNEYQFDDEAVIIPLVSSTGHGDKSLNRIHYQTGKFALGSILCAILPNDKKVLNSEYLYYFLDLNKEKELVGRMKGMANVTLPMKEIAEIEIPIPSLEIQKFFVKKYKNLEYQNNLTSFELTHQLSLIKQLRQAFLREAMQGKLVPQDPYDGDARDLLKQIKAEKTKLISDKKLKKEKELPPIKPEDIPFEIPDNWVWCRLGEIGFCQTGTTPSTMNKKLFGNDIPFIKPADITLKGLIIDNEGLSYEGLRYGILVPINSVLMVCIGGSIGKSYFNKMEVSCNQQINCVTPISGIIPNILQYFFQSDYFQKSIWKKVSGGTTPIINRSKWESLIIPMPPKTKIMQIVQKLDELMTLCDDLEKSLTRSKEQNEMLLQQVLREALRGGE